MSSPTLKNRRPGRWLVLVMAICIGVPVLLTTQGCCSWCPKRCMPTTPVITFYMKECLTNPANIREGVWYFPPGLLKVSPGHPLQVVNATHHTLWITPSVAVFKDRPDDQQTGAYQLEELDSRPLTVLSSATPGGIRLNVRVEQPGHWYQECDSTQPGPGVDIEKPH
jgi:hypothetical protein